MFLMSFWHPWHASFPGKTNQNANTFHVTHCPIPIKMFDVLMTHERLRWPPGKAIQTQIVELFGFLADKVKSLRAFGLMTLSFPDLVNTRQCTYGIRNLSAPLCRCSDGFSTTPPAAERFIDVVQKCCALIRSDGFCFKKDSDKNKTLLVKHQLFIVFTLNK